MPPAEARLQRSPCGHLEEHRLLALAGRLERRHLLQDLPRFSRCTCTVTFHASVAAHACLSPAVSAASDGAASRNHSPDGGLDDARERRQEDSGAASGDGVASTGPPRGHDLLQQISLLGEALALDGQLRRGSRSHGEEQRDRPASVERVLRVGHSAARARPALQRHVQRPLRARGPCSIS